jgi:hypothetical protein
MPTTKKACVDCKHFYSDPDYGGTSCYHPDLMRFDVIYGKNPSDARDNRETFRNKCGPQGKLWEKKASKILWFREFFGGVDSPGIVED